VERFFRQVRRQAGLPAFEGGEIVDSGIRFRFRMEMERRVAGKRVL
jgi:hypothetical protein